MVKITMKIEGTMCRMCESQINDAIRRSFAVKKVSSSRSKGRTEILAKDPLDESALRKTIEEIGYSVLSVHAEEYQKKGLLGH